MGRKKGKKDEGVRSGIVDHETCEWKMYIREQEEAEFKSANPTSVGHKIDKV
jgi:hypothetical protein